MSNALINPPMPEWNALRNEETTSLTESWEMFSCPHSCSGDALSFYNAVRELLQEREKRIFQATMDMPTRAEANPHDAHKQ